MKNNLKKIIVFIIVIAAIICVAYNPLQKAFHKSVYANSDEWAYCEVNVQDKDADVFFITPTVYLGSEDELEWLTYDDETTQSFIGAINMEKGIYDDNARFFAPFYRQASISAYYAKGKEKDAVFDQAYSDIKDAFDYYMDHYNNGRPLIIAGFSQGAQMSIRLLEEYVDNQELKDVLVACYAIGWSFTEEDIKAYPNIKLASNETDTGVLITFNSEDKSINDSLMIPSGTKTYAINPLNWSTSNEVVDKSYNLGACFTDYSGTITTEIPNLTGAYIDNDRGALKVTDVHSKDYPGVLFEDGIYHLYDYQFFYRNLEKNVQDRINAFVQ